MSDDNGETIGFRFCPDKVSEMATEAAELLWLAGIAAGGIELQEQLEESPPEGFDEETTQRWRRNQQAALSELRLQFLHSVENDGAGADDRPNLTVIKEAGSAAQVCVNNSLKRIADSAITQARIVSGVQLWEASEAINPTPPAPQPSPLHQLRARVGNALWSAGDGLHDFCERAGNVIGRMLRSPLAWLAGLISPADEP